MKIDKLKYIILSCIGSAFLFSCNSLDQEPTNKYTDATFWQSTENAESIVNMAYSQMYGAGKLWNDEGLSDNVIEGRDNNDGRMIRNGLADPSLGRFASEWKWAYEGIKTCHKFLENVDQVPKMSAALKEQRKAEVRFIRAFIYFRLVNFYGDVPFFTSDISLSDSKTISRTSKTTVLKFIHDELDDIVQYLPARNSSFTAENNGRITKGAALAFQARAYLYESNWSKVEECTSKLINEQATYGTYGLFNNYEALFHTENKYNEEVILDYGYTTSYRTWNEMYSRVPMSVGAFLNSCAPTQELVDDYITVNGLSIDKDPSYKESEPYKDRDPRLTYTVVYNGYKWTKPDGTSVTIETKSGANTPDAWQGTNSNRSITGYYIRKYYDPESTSSESNYSQHNNIIMFRYADVLLMHAEAMFEQNKMSQTVWNETIKPIRLRAGFSGNALNYPSALSATEMRELIHRERRSELALEGLRYYDIIRWKEGSKYLNGVVHGAKFANNNTAYITLDTRKFNENKDYLWSVPRSQIQLNPNLKPNNPGYAN
ncbi:RagB/SusD family nutrient uptake outer membrane protein [Dysgonomonas sp. Marseille-P4677]|uniref:RagB/SusD family nutrient uptake outer membrane protein n=1 Tax=Dysgonomonas sp. Marseille-P4677 TaxID=2364790 RepID=UPI0019145254|nr:RagB/SusD family nutrient uptake outer membrane protein [Dysgonomonas sp. Marseille-P4677]MBK5720892.1 RagB/SusD family nutrient uptake outer membrane protein [Dysgonomonas sp. Marseille-P4677]